MRSERVLASWDSWPAERLSAYLSGFWAYVEELNDRERLELLAQRTMKAFEQGMPEGDRLHLLRLCIAGVAHGRDDASCDILLPLVRHKDVRIATLAAETVGAYKTEPRFVPRLLVEALASERQTVVEAALRFVVDCRDEKRREGVHQALRKIFEQRDESLKFQACLPLMREFRDPYAWIYVLEQTTSKDANRVRTAFSWIADTKNCGQPPDELLLVTLGLHIGSKHADQRQAATAVLGTFAGEQVVRQLIPLLADGDASVARQADAGLLAQPDRTLVQRLLKEAAAKSPQPIVRSRAQELLAKMPQS
jgi:HEAT repeat protein